MILTLMAILTMVAETSFPIACCIKQDSNGECVLRSRATICLLGDGCTRSCRGIESVHGNYSSCESDWLDLREMGTITAPEYMLPMVDPTYYSGNPSRRRVLGFLDDILPPEWIGVARTLPVGIGTIAATLSPEYDLNKGNALKDEILGLASELADVATQVRDVERLLAQESLIRLEADRLLAKGVQTALRAVEDLRLGASNADSRLYEMITMNTLAIGALEDSTSFWRSVDRQVSILSDVAGSSYAYKIMQIATLAGLDQRVVLPTNHVSYNYEVISYSWKFLKVTSSRLIPVGKWVVVTVEKRPSAMSYLVDADAEIRRVSYRMIRIGTEPYFNTTCASPSLCFERRVTEVYSNLTYDYNGFSEFNTGRMANNESECGNSSDAFSCQLMDGSMYPRVGAYQGDEVTVGPGYFILWLKCGVVIEGCRLLTNDCTIRDKTGVLSWPCVTLFHDPYKIVDAYRPERSASPSDLQGLALDLFESGGRGNNLVLAKYGDFINMTVGMNGMQTVIMTAEYFQSSQAVLDFTRGTRPFSGYIPDDSCEIEGGRVCCREGLVLPFVSNIQNPNIDQAQADPKLSLRGLFLNSKQYTLWSISNLTEETSALIRELNSSLYGLDSLSISEKARDLEKRINKTIDQVEETKESIANAAVPGTSDVGTYVAIVAMVVCLILCCAMAYVIKVTVQKR